MRFVEKILPKYAWLPIFLVVAVNLVAYYLSPLLAVGTTQYDLSVIVDKSLPVVPFFVFFYVLAYLQWASGHIINSRDSELLCYKMATADIIAKLICMVFFIFLPTRIVRPEIVGNGVFDMATRLIYSIDKPVNLFPSIHCLESYICFRCALMMQKKNKIYIIAQGVVAILVFASTILIKQHFFVDIFGGIIVVEIGLFLSDKLKWWRIMDKIQIRSFKPVFSKDTER